MSFKHIKGPALIEYWPKTASTTLTARACVGTSGGYLIAATASETDIKGVLQKAIASTDSDFASATKIPVLIPQATDEFEVDMTSTTTFTATHVGLKGNLDATGQYVDVTVSTYPHCTVLRGGSATNKVVVKINGAYTFRNAN
uniref:Uncharacterized protein n=1 Tax=viral metagenome TaxID=1070528 RepID=A0A6M3XVQ7_9ZZZZ